MSLIVRSASRGAGCGRAIVAILLQVKGQFDTVKYRDKVDPQNIK
jgi:hypothetical protein